MTQMPWYCRKGDERLGPLKPKQLRALADRGEIAPDALISRHENGPWFEAAMVKGLFDDAVEDGHVFDDEPTTSPSTVKQARVAPNPKPLKKKKKTSSPSSSKHGRGAASGAGGGPRQNGQAKQAAPPPKALPTAAPPPHRTDLPVAAPPRATSGPPPIAAVPGETVPGPAYGPGLAPPVSSEDSIFVAPSLSAHRARRPAPARGRLRGWMALES